MSRAVVTLHSDFDRQKAIGYINGAPEGARVEIKEAKRSLAQNDKLWGDLSDIAEQVEWYGQKLDPEDWKDMFTASLRKLRVVPGLDAGSFVPLGMRTSDMSKGEFSDLLELISAFGAERGVVFKNAPPLPESYEDARSGPPGASHPEAEKPAERSPAGPVDTSSSAADPHQADDGRDGDSPVAVPPTESAVADLGPEPDATTMEQATASGSAPDIAECARKLFVLATDGGTLTVDERRAELERLKDDWKAALPASEHDRLKAIVRTCDDVIRGRTEPSTARDYLASLRQEEAA